jgi:hypothetical protein
LLSVRRVVPSKSGWRRVRSGLSKCCVASTAKLEHLCRVSGHVYVPVLAVAVLLPSTKQLVRHSSRMEAGWMAALSVRFGIQHLSRCVAGSQLLVPLRIRNSMLFGARLHASSLLNACRDTQTFIDRHRIALAHASCCALVSSKPELPFPHPSCVMYSTLMCTRIQNAIYHPAYDDAVLLCSHADQVYKVSGFSTAATAWTNQTTLQRHFGCDLDDFSSSRNTYMGVHLCCCASQSEMPLFASANFKACQDFDECSFATDLAVCAPATGFLALSIPSPIRKGSVCEAP